MKGVWTLLIALVFPSVCLALGPDQVARGLVESALAKPTSQLSKMLSAALNVPRREDLLIRMLEWKPSSSSNENHGVVEITFHDDGAAEQVIVEAEIRENLGWAYVYSFKVVTNSDYKPGPGISIGTRP